MNQNNGVVVGKGGGGHSSGKGFGEVPCELKPEVSEARQVKNWENKYTYVLRGA